MECHLLLFIYFVLLQLDRTENTASYSIRKKRQDDQWSWGFIDVTSSEKAVTETQAPDVDENPCNLKPPPMPDFSQPGRRISVQKCYEYIWNIKYREEEARINDECTNYRIKNKPNNVQFAIGGRAASPGEFPHMAGVGWKASEGTWIFKCGSSLISSKFVLTAAHCSKASERDPTIADVVPKIVRLGDKNIIDVWSKGLPPTDVNITNIIVHPQYNSPKKYYDIALMELEHEVKFTDNIQPGCLWTEFNTDPLGEEATVTGWGVVETAKHTNSPELQAAVINLLDSSICDKLLRPRFNRHWNGMQEHQLCAGKLAGGVDSCQGDSGGPLQVRIPLPSSSQGAMHYIVGITSFGFECALPDTPAVYTRVSYFVDWIESIVWK